MIPKGATVVEIAAGSPEFDGSVTGSCELHQIVAPPIDHRDFCSKSTAKSRLEVDEPPSSLYSRRVMGIAISQPRLLRPATVLSLTAPWAEVCNVSMAINRHDYRNQSASGGRVDRLAVQRYRKGRADFLLAESGVATISSVAGMLPPRLRIRLRMNPPAHQEPKDPLAPEPCYELRQRLSLSYEP